MESILEPSLSILLPVYNVQGELASQVTRLLDVLPELTDRFDVLIVDDGSTDDTLEAAHDLARQFPQVRVTRNEGLGSQSAVSTGMQCCQGEVVIVQEEPGPPKAEQLHKLWALRGDRRLVMAQAETRRATHIDRLMGWGGAVTQSSDRPAEEHGLRMIRCKGVAQWRLAEDSLATR